MGGLPRPDLGVGPLKGLRDPTSPNPPGGGFSIFEFLVHTYLFAQKTKNRVRGADFCLCCQNLGDRFNLDLRILLTVTNLSVSITLSFVPQNSNLWTLS